MSRLRNRWLRWLAVFMGAGLLLQATSCNIFTLPTAQDLVNFAVGFGREAFAAFIL